ncbi:MAG: spore coat U domain-containing protein [Gammaproteobacteria bacterium]|nr:spore coat U domain-containing protein [Gammaproteobacteria bacterium]MBT8444185.1 spore coat U domain-containing protein [Gammaproteobacteria bacterium]NND36923.1 spore coat protein U domain-containing protein [Gammaproteobacteria bacterium]
MKLFVRRTALALLVGLLFTPAAEARTCFLWQIDGVSFGNYFPMQPGPLDARGRIRVLCWGRASGGQGSSYTVRISGIIAPGPYGRRMNSGGDQLEYNLYKDAARTDVWGDGSFGATPLLNVFGNNQFVVGNHWVYGRVPPLLDPASGSYNDVVDVTIEF